VYVAFVPVYDVMKLVGPVARGPVSVLKGPVQLAIGLPALSTQMVFLSAGDNLAYVDLQRVVLKEALVRVIGQVVGLPEGVGAMEGTT